MVVAGGAGAQQREGVKKKTKKGLRIGKPTLSTASAIERRARISARRCARPSLARPALWWVVFDDAPIDVMRLRVKLETRLDRRDRGANKGRAGRAHGHKSWELGAESLGIGGSTRWGSPLAGVG